MTHEELTRNLTAIAGHLNVTQQANAADLETARRSLAASLLAGIPAAQLSARAAPLQAVTTPEIEKLVTGVLGAPATKAALAFVRTSPVQSQFDPATPQWARGMLVTQTLGPFAQANGEPAWVDLIALTKGMPYQFTSAAAPFAILPIAHSPTGRPNASHIGPGSVWIFGRLLTPGAPVNSWVGFRIKAGGTLAAARLLINPDNIGVQGIACTLTADLDPPPAPPVVTGPGVDASRAQVDLPASIQIEFTPTSATIKLLSPFGLTVYDQRVNITWNGGAPFYNDPAKEIFVPGDVDLGPGGNFTFGPAGSAVFQPSGKSPVATAAWGLQVAITTPDKLGEAAGAGGIAVSVGPVISGTWKQSAKAVPFSSLTLQAAPGQIGLMAVLAAPEQQTFQLWDEAPLPNGKVRASTLDFAAPAGTPLFFATAVINGQGSEQMTIGGTVAAHTDRPVGVDGLRLPYSGAALLSIFENSTGIFLVVQAAGKITDRLIAIALENALVRVFSPQFLFVFGKLGDTRVDQGALVFFFHIEQLLPILPDPYAASFKSPLQTPGNLQSLVTWLAPETPELSFSLQVDPKTQLPSDGNNLAFISRAHYNLVDVSSNVDQLGVSWVPKVPADIVAQKLAIAAQGDVVSLFTVSEISWEPMDSKDPIPTPPTDGIPSKVTVPTVKLTPVEPLPLLNAQLASVKGGAAVLIDTALPFGLIASIGNKTGNTVSRFDLNQPDFDTDAAALGGGLQLTLTPKNFKAENPLFPGSTLVTEPYGHAVLGDDVTTIFGGQFKNGGVPLRRYDLSGYGASVFSEWANSDADGAAIVKAQFDVFVGRTSHDLIQAQSVIYPWGIKVVRTIIIDRRSGGKVVRVDTGWQAATPGIFHFVPKVNDIDANVHPGAIQGVFNVRRIRDNGPRLDPINGITFAPVLFDGDFNLDPRNKVVAGGSGTFVPSQNIAGYLQVDGFRTEPLPGGSPGQTVRVPLTVRRVELGELLKKTGPVGGPVACTVDIGSAGQQMAATSVDVSAAFDGGGLAFFVPALRGAPILPRDGAWSVGRKNAGTFSTPVALDPHFAVPLVQNNGDKKTWHLADPSDILNLDKPNLIQVQYGFLQATGTQKIFFGRPQVPQLGAAPPIVRIPDVPHLADVGALLNASGFFPDLKSALDFPSPQNLDLAGDRNFKIAPPAFPITAAAKTLVDFKVVQIVLDYKHKDNSPTLCTVVVDPAANPRWSIKLEGVTLALASPFGDKDHPLIKVVGTIIADANSAPTLKDLEVVYGSILSTVQEIFSRLQELATFLPGGKKLAALDVSFSDGKLSIHQQFALPTLPLGLGDISDVAIVLGAVIQLSPKSMTFTAGIGSQEKPFHWLVSLLSGTGCVEVGFQDDKPTILIQAGLGVGLEINLAIASGSASIVIALQVDNKRSPFEVIAILTGQASVDVLAGLASASITLSAGLGIVPALVNPPEITLIGSVAVGIHISICWVVDVDFDGYWQFSQTLKSPVSLPLP